MCVYPVGRRAQAAYRLACSAPQKFRTFFDAGHYVIRREGLKRSRMLNWPAPGGGDAQEIGRELCRPASSRLAFRVSVRANSLARLSRMPTMRQQLRNLTGPLRRQTRQHFFEMGMRVVPIVTGRLDQTHDCSGAFATAQRPSEEPVFAPQRPRPYLVVG